MDFSKSYRDFIQQRLKVLHGGFLCTYFNLWSVLTEIIHAICPFLLHAKLDTLKCIQSYYFQSQPTVLSKFAGTRLCICLLFDLLRNICTRHHGQQRP